MDKRQKKQEDSCVVLDGLHESCMYNILGRLPIESLCTSKLVCKSWYAIVNSPYFRNTHLRDTRGIIFTTPVQNFSPPLQNRKVFSVESNSTITDVQSTNFHIKFMEFNKGGKSRVKEYCNTAFRGRIVAARDGIIVLEKDFRTRGLLLLNPVTREQEHVPMGTISSAVRDGDLYGFAAASYCHASRRYYKLLRLFMKDKFSNLGCEIMDIIGSGGGLSWRAVDVPPIKRGSYHLLHSPVFAMGALHWIQHVEEGECMVSMPLDDDKFRITPIPPTAKMGQIRFPNFNTVFEMGGFLGFSSRTGGEDNQIQVWILRDSWEKQYDIDGSGLGYLTPLLYCEGLVLKCGDQCFYAYDPNSGDLTKIETRAAIDGYWTMFPHVNTLVSWRTG